MAEFHRSFRIQILLSIFGVFLILALSTAYILVCSQRLQKISENSFKQERFIKSLQEDLEALQTPLMEYLSTRSSNALASILIDTQLLRQKIPGRVITGDKADLKERELYSLVFNYLNLAEQAMEEKRGRNISAYTMLSEEMTGLMGYINNEIDAISTVRFRNQLDAYEQFLAESGTIQLWNFLFLISVSLFVIVLLFLSISHFTNPLLRLSAMAQELSAGNFGISDMEAGVNEEMDRVIKAFNNMKNDIRSNIEEIRWQENIKQEYMREKMRNMKMEGLVRHMEIYALQAQMNPHFLFNTINTGMQLAIVEGADRTGEYMDYMARLFRHIIRNKEIIVPLRHEIQGLDYFFYILKVRFPSDLNLTLECDQTLLDTCKVPVSILQPLVENCVIHAFRAASGGRDSRAPAADTGEPPAAGAGTGEKTRNVAVRVFREEQYLVLSVEDNGRGMDRELVERLLHPQSLDESSVSRVMGLENVIQRLYFFYPGDMDVVRIKTGPEGTAVIISIDTEKEPCLAF
ncbi:MAG: histidine kinase [Treponema sp.]|jgi:sensor histidine kinase YesM|nr:histidine kinase [Treponema sp.]